MSFPRKACPELAVALSEQKLALSLAEWVEGAAEWAGIHIIDTPGYPCLRRCCTPAFRFTWGRLSFTTQILFWVFSFLTPFSVLLGRDHDRHKGLLFPVR